MEMLCSEKLIWLMGLTSKLLCQDKGLTAALFPENEIRNYRTAPTLEHDDCRVAAKQSLQHYPSSPMHYMSTQTNRPCS